MPIAIFIALGAGAVSAIAFASAAVGHPFAAGLFFLLTPLPLFLCGLSLGWRSAALAGAAGIVILTLIGTVQTGLFYAATAAGPAAFLCYQALLHRERTDPAGGATTLEWYPAGRLVVWSAIIGGLLALLLVAVLGGTPDALRVKMAPAIEGLVKTITAEMKGAPGIGEKDIPQITEIAVALLPAMAAILPMMSFIFNLWFAGKITLAAGHLARPWPDLALLSYPAGTAFALLAAMFSTTLGGHIAMAGTAISGTLYVAYVFMGLAIFHYVTRGQPWRQFALWALYAGMFIISGGVTLIVALIGLLDSVYPLRRGPPKSQGPPAG